VYNDFTCPLANGDEGRRKKFNSLLLLRVTLVEVSREDFFDASTGGDDRDLRNGNRKVVSHRLQMRIYYDN
jgi:hypothetical protein